MPKIEVTIAGKEISLICAEHEIAVTKAAAEILDEEIGICTSRNPNQSFPHLLLLAAIVLADKVSALNAEIQNANNLLADFENHAVESGLPTPDRSLAEILESFASKSEDLADRMEQVVAADI